jgi:hypothetical protein
MWRRTKLAPGVELPPVTGAEPFVIIIDTRAPTIYKMKVKTRQKARAIFGASYDLTVIEPFKVLDGPNGIHAEITVQARKKERRDRPR